MWTRREVLLIVAIVSLTAAGTAVVYVASSGSATGLVPFRSYAELAGFIGSARAALQDAQVNGGLFASPATPVPAPSRGSPTTGNPSAPAYSGTNVQVQGIDELDLAKTDGTYLYLASGSEVDVLLAYPAASMHLVSRIRLGNLTDDASGTGTGLSATGLFLDGSTLVVVGQAYAFGAYDPMQPAPMIPTTGGSVASSLLPRPERTLVFLLDVSDPATPVLLHTISVTGMPSTGRMVDGTVYVVATEWIQAINGTYLLPQVCIDGSCSDLAPEQVYHDPQSEDAWDYTNLLAVDLVSAHSSVMSIVTGGYSLLYMSPTAMYLAFYKWAAVPLGLASPLLPVRMSGGHTTIYKLRADGVDLSTVGSADVPGSLISQYALDEWNGDLRVATTVRDFTANASTVSNGVFVFDENMSRIGAVDGLAPGESIFAVRFLGNRAYVVTFRKIDPLFVVDLSDPAHPVVSGFLEMPGFSQYLYPLDAGHLVGVGKDAIPAEEGNWSWYQGLKLSLYNVSRSTAPNETANVTIGDRGTASEVLYDPHAFLYVPDHKLLVLPVDLAIVNASEYPQGVPEWAWGTVVWQGVIVYRVNETTGFQELARIAHDNGTVNETCGWYASPKEIRRSLFIGDVLYTISGTEVMANSLTDFSEISTVAYGTVSSDASGCPVPIPLRAA